MKHEGDGFQLRAEEVTLNVCKRNGDVGRGLVKRRFEESNSIN